MGMKKLNLSYISNNTTKKATFNSRKRGFFKKLHELKTLCDVDACAVIVNPFNSTPEVWPSNSEVSNVVQKFETLTEVEKTSGSVSHEDFLIQSIKKAKKQNKRLAEDNKEKFMTELMFACLNGNMGELNMDDDDVHRDLCKFIDQYCKNLLHHQNNPHHVAMATNMAPTTMAEAGSSSPQLTNEPEPIITSNHGPEYFSSHGCQFLNVPNFNLPQQTNEMQSTISPNQGIDQVRSLGCNFMSAPIFNSPQVTNEMQQQPTISSYQGIENFDSLASNHEVDTPIMIQNHQDWYVEEMMMKHSEQTSFPLMEENHHYNHHQF